MNQTPFIVRFSIDPYTFVGCVDILKPMYVISRYHLNTERLVRWKTFYLFNLKVTVLFNHSQYKMHACAKKDRSYKTPGRSINNDTFVPKYYLVLCFIALSTNSLTV